MNPTSILIVEDDAIVAADLAGKLKGLGYCIAGSTATGEDAVVLARELRPSLLLMDIQLAGAMDGVAAAAAVRHECDLPVVFLAAHSERPTLQRAEVAEAFGYVLRPFRDRELQAQIEMALHKHAADRRLRESEARLRTLGDNFPGGAIYQHVRQLDGQLKYGYVSAGIEKILGISAERVMADPEVLMQLIVEEDRPRVAAAKLQSAKEMVLFDCEFRQRTVSGAVKWVHARSMPRRLEDGSTLWDGVVADITERKQAEEALKQSVSLLRATLESTTDGLLMVDRSGKITDFNQRFTELWHLPADVLAERDDQKAIEFVLSQLQDPEQFSAGVRRLYAESEISSFDVLRFKDGRVVERYSQPQWLNGKAVGRVWSFRDVTERKQNEEMLLRFQISLEQLVRKRTQLLRQSEAHLKEAQEIAHLGNFEIDLKTQRVRGSDELYRIFGFETDKPVTLDIYQHSLDPADFDSVMAAVERAAQAGEPYRIEHSIRLADGSRKEVFCIGHPVVDSEGQTRAIFGTVQDITEHKQAERALAELNRKLVDASRQAGMAEVATSVLHNVGNVLTSVNISTSLLLEQVRRPKHESVTDLARLIAEHRSHLGEFLVNDPCGRLVPEILIALSDYLDTEQAEQLRELETLHQGIGHLKQIVAMQQSYASHSGILEIVSVEGLVEDALRLESSELKDQNVRIQRVFEPVPPIAIDRNKVLQILVNLLRNAVQALAARGDEERHIVLGIAPCAEGGVFIHVQDSGEGIAPEELAKIFAFGYTTRSDGHGFGLHHGANAAKEMGGKLSVRSDGAGQGAVFTLQLPRGPA